MAARKVAITIGEDLLVAVDELVRKRVYPNRSQAIQSAVRDKVERLRHTRLAREARKLRPKEEQALAEEGIQGDAKEWPEY